MSAHYITSGFQRAKARPRLAAIMYAANLAMGLILSIPVLIAFSNATELSGYSEEMAGGFDLALWADLLESSGPLVQTLLAQMLWILPILFVWKMGSSAGLIHAQSEGGSRSFWKGFGLHTMKATLLGLLFLIPTAAWVVFVVVVATVLSTFLTGEVGSFWVQFVFSPLALFLGIALIDMMHDFGRIDLVLGKSGIKDSWLNGMKWPFHSANANSIYIGWMVLGLIFLVFPFMLDLSMAGLVLAFLVQQVLLYGRSFITVGWISSEVLLYEDLFPVVESQEAPSETETSES
ncbi:MAG: hypothetical protein O3B41_09670 [Bacteroidetes bacterium]|nr:hypothetical protein [Bacteroidota bacterium]